MAIAFTKLNGFVENLAEGAFDFENDAIVVALSNTAPGSESPSPTGTAAECVLANVTPISYTNVAGGATITPRTLANVTSSQTAGVETVDADNITISASGGNVGPFQYVYLYDDTTTTPADPLIGYFDYGSALTLADGESLTITFNASGILTIT